MKHHFIAGGLLLLLLVPLSPCRGASISLVNHTNAWRYRKGTTAPQATWKTVAESSLDGTWLSGNGGIGFADEDAWTVGVKPEFKREILAVEKLRRPQGGSEEIGSL